MKKIFINLPKETVNEVIRHNFVASCFRALSVSETGALLGCVIEVLEEDVTRLVVSLRDKHQISNILAPGDLGREFGYFEMPLKQNFALMAGLWLAKATELVTHDNMFVPCIFYEDVGGCIAYGYQEGEDLRKWQFTILRVSSDCKIDWPSFRTERLTKY